MPEEDKDKEIQIIIKDVSYDSPAAEFIYTRGKEIEKNINSSSQAPKTIEEALVFRELRKNLDYKELIEELISAIPDWKNAPLEELETHFRLLCLDSHVLEEIRQNSAMIQSITEKMADKDSTQIQIAIVRNPKGHAEYAYTYLVVYPPDPLTGNRIREASYPTAMCHLIDANALMSRSETVTCRTEPYQVSFNQTPPISDEDLTRIVKETGKTPLDRLIQSGLKVFDQLKGRSGEHIDPVSAVTNREYAVKYALATHRGVGLVDNEKISLPPLSN